MTDSTGPTPPTSADDPDDPAEPISPIEPISPVESVSTSQVLELYKLAVEMADRVSARRGTANAFFLSVQTALVGVLGLSFPKLQEAPWWAAAALTTAGLALSVAWWLQLRSYRDLNEAKFKVINDMENQLPVKIFADEWEHLKRDELIPAWRKRYAELGFSERSVPWVFFAVYVLVLLGKLFG